MENSTSAVDEMSMRPSFFEVYAAQHLHTTMRPAVRFALDVLAVRQPRLRVLANWSDELFAAVLGVIEVVQLRRDAALLSESFYALRRSAVSVFTPSARDVRPSYARIVLAVVLHVLVPYASVRLHDLHASATGGAAADLFDGDGALFPAASLLSEDDVVSHPIVRAPPTARWSASRPKWLCVLQTVMQSPRRALAFANAVLQYLRGARFRALVVRWYPTTRCVIDICNVVLGLLYVYGHCRYFSLSLLVQRVVLRRDSQLDFVRSALADKLRLRHGALSFSGFVDRLLSGVKTGFLASIFAFRFLQYYYAAEASMPRDVGPSVMPPQMLHPVDGVDERTALASGMCPLCAQSRVNPTACTSGKCPITLAPTGVDDLIRVYDHDDLIS